MAEPSFSLYSHIYSVSIIVSCFYFQSIIITGLAARGDALTLAVVPAMSVANIMYVYFQLGIRCNRQETYRVHVSCFKGGMWMNSNREYKSDVFSMLMEIPEYALEIYNVLNGSHYTDQAQVQIKKLEKGVLLSIRNDASFVLDACLNLYEHQSTYNPNMPLRFLIYFTHLLLDLVKEQEYDLFGQKRIPIPTPKFVVFYNGLTERPEKEEMCLSDAYEHREKQYELDLKCIAYNINPGYNQDIQKNSRVLSGYTAFVEKVRTYTETEAALKDAVERAVEECIQEDILAEFFVGHRREVVHVAALDFTFEQREKLIRRDSLQEGIEIGISQGISQGREQGIAQGETQKLVSLVCRKLQKGKTVAVIAEELEEEPMLVEQICEMAKSFAPGYDVQEICKALKQ